MIGGICVFILCAGALLFFAPGLAFSHTAGDGRITFRATEPLSEAAAQRAAALAWAAMQDTPFGQPNHAIDVYVTGGSGWRHQLFFRPAPWAGGLTYAVFSTRRVFLRGVDLEAGRLIGSEGPIPDPRDLTNYLVHEMTHLRHAEIVGPIAFLRTRRWVTEAIPDLAALGPAGPDLITAAMAGEALPRAVFGSYPMERACATMMIAVPGFGIEELMDIRAPMHAPETCFTLPPPDSD